MKITNWRKKLAAAIVAAGIMVPGVARAGVITVPDADFKTFDVTNSPALTSYAYANYSSGKGPYRTGDPNTASPWVDDLGHNAGNYIQDSGRSNWLSSVPTFSSWWIVSR